MSKISSADLAELAELGNEWEQEALKTAKSLNPENVKWATKKIALVWVLSLIVTIAYGVIFSQVKKIIAGKEEVGKLVGWAIASIVVISIIIFIIGYPIFAKGSTKDDPNESKGTVSTWIILIGLLVLLGVTITSVFALIGKTEGGLGLAKTLSATVFGVSLAIVLIIPILFLLPLGFTLFFKDKLLKAMGSGGN
jgi:hypothetical protein